MLKITNLEKRYTDKKVLNGLNLHIEKGEILGFVGANGAGKTHLLPLNPIRMYWSAYFMGY